jgi:hypothetical protein
MRFRMSITSSAMMDPAFDLTFRTPCRSRIYKMI